MFDAYTVNWLHLLARWAHILTGAAWIGTSFYFIFLNNSIRPPDNDQDDGPAVKGVVWMVHGGAFYRTTKYDGAPNALPTTLHFGRVWWLARVTWDSRTPGGKGGCGINGASDSRLLSLCTSSACGETSTPILTAACRRLSCGEPPHDTRSLGEKRGGLWYGGGLYEGSRTLACGSSIQSTMLFQES